LTGPAIGSAVGAVEPAAGARTTATAATTFACRATGPTIQTYLQALERERLRYFHANSATRRASLSVAAVLSVMASAGLPPGTTTGLAIGAIQAYVTWRTRTAASINYQRVSRHVLKTNTQRASRQ
jgi:hypothetical protein